MAFFFGGHTAERTAQPGARAGGNIAGIEILDASKRVGNPMSVEYAIAR
jgi:hypothetical protein